MQRAGHLGSCQNSSALSKRVRHVLLAANRDLNLPLHKDLALFQVA